MSALGVPTEVSRKQPLNRFQMYLGLPDALACKRHADSSHLQELANSFGHDVLNIAALAGRLLWYEGVTPEIWRSHDLIAVAVDSEAYYVMLQTACDIMADVIVTLGAKKRGQAPWESFHKLNEWAIQNPGRLDPSYHLVATDLRWFGRINKARTGFIHRGKTMLVYTDRVTFNWGKLISGFRDLTKSMLDFSETLGLVVTSDNDRQKVPQKKIIDGVYVPALHHLLHEYAVPQESERDRLKFKARYLLACGGYVEAAYIGYPSGFWWTVLTSSFEKMTSEPIAANIPINVGGTVHDCKFVISDGKKRYGIIACDHGSAGDAWFEGAAKSTEKLQSEYSTQRTAFVVREMQGDALEVVPGTQVPLIVGDSAPEISRKLVAALQK